MNVPSLLTWAKSCMPMHCHRPVAKVTHKVQVLTLGELGSAELWRLSFSTKTLPASVESPVPVLSPPGFGAAVNFGRVILSPFLLSESSLVRMPSRELSLWWREGVRKREVKEKGGMDRHSHERADINVHENEEKGDIDKRARVEYVLLHGLRQQDGDT
jgi:hypothetical protein